MRRGFIRAAGALALALSCALLMNPAMAEEYPGDTYVTATFLDAEAHTRDGWGARAGLSLEGFPSRRVVLSSALSYRAADDYATFIPGLGLEAGYRFPVAGLCSVITLAGLAFELPVSAGSTSPSAALTLSSPVLFRLFEREYLTVTPSLCAPVYGGGQARFALSLGVRRETPWMVPVKDIGLEMTASPALFSPDDDGADDLTVIAIDALHPRSIREWNVEIVRDDGSRWRSFSGTGRPPRRILWDGSADDGRACDAGDVYSISLTARDAIGRVSRCEATVKVTVDILVLKDGDRYKVRVPNILFPANSAELTSAELGSFLEDNYATLSRIASLFARFPEHSLIVEGYANAVHWDDPERYRVEQETELLPLSRRRVEAVREALVSLGVAYSRITVKAFGGERPVADYSSREAGWKNRRVEFILERNATPSYRPSPR